MKFTFNWLKGHLETTKNLDEILNCLNSIGFEVEDVKKIGENFIIAEIIDCIQHPNADKLRLCTVSTGKEELQIVCGASNARKGIKVVLARIGAVIPNGNFEIKKSKIRGCESYGMLCSYDELGLKGDSDGIIELDDSHGGIGENFQIDPIIEISVTPNRGDALSVYGIARDLAAAGFGKLKQQLEQQIPSIEEKIATIEKVENKLDICIENNEKCINFCAIYIEGIENLASSKIPKWISDRLEAIGAKSISAIVDIANYMMFTYGTPMHVYDADKISDNKSENKSENKLIVDVSQEEEDFHAIDGNHYKIPAGSIIIRDSQKTQCIAGIIGSKDSECSLDTKNIILECANFNHVDIAIAKQKLGINTESAYRFERQVDNEMIEKVIKLTTDLMVEICGGKISNIKQEKKEETNRKIIKFDFQKFEEVTGINIEKEEISRILISLGFDVSMVQKTWEIKVPSWRNDITTQNCIIEEVLRIYGYDKLLETPLHPNKLIVYRESNKELLRRLMISRGFFEVISWSFMDRKNIENVEGLSLNQNSSQNSNLISIKNPIAKNLNVMRPSTVYNLHEIAQNNKKNGVKDVRIFEIGSVYKENTENKENREDKKDTKEITVLSGLRAGKSGRRNIYNIPYDMDFFDVKADVISIMNLLNISNYELSEAGVPKYYHTGRSASLIANKKTIGFVGELHPKMVNNDRVAAFEIFLDELDRKQNGYKYKKLSKYPQVERDFAFVFNKSENFKLKEIIDLIKSCSKLIKGVELFDQYEDNNLYSGKVSLAFMVVIEDIEKTLDSDTINEISDFVIKKVSERFNATLRRDYSIST